MGDINSPNLSVVILTPDRYATIRRTMAALRAQTIADQIEVVVVAPSKDSLPDDGGELAAFDHQVVEIGPLISTTIARAAGIRRARSPLVALAEDHSFPEPDWAERFIIAHKGPWAVVGPALGNANPDSALSWANLAIEYGSWIDPAISGEAEHLPGHNSCYKRTILLEYGDDLEAMLEAESVLHWDLRSKGHRLYFDADIKTFHLNYSLFGPSMVLRFLGGRSFAAARSRPWTVWKRLLYALSSPLIPLRRGRRILTDLRRVRQYRRFMPKMLVLLAALLFSDGLGEMWGYLFGSGNEMARLCEMEFKRQRFMKADEVLLTTDRPQIVAAPVE